MEVDLGNGRRFKRSGFQGELFGVAPIHFLITSLDGQHATVRDGPSAFVPAVVAIVGLGTQQKQPWREIVQKFAKKSMLVLLVPGPSDAMDEMRSSLETLGPRIQDGTTLRQLRVGSVELVTLPGSTDATLLAESGNGCVLRPDDVHALTKQLTPSNAATRLLLSHASPESILDAKGAPIALSLSNVWFVAAPRDEIPLPQMNVPSVIQERMVLQVPRLGQARTSSEPGSMSAGYWHVQFSDGFAMKVIEAASF